MLASLSDSLIDSSLQFFVLSPLLSVTFKASKDSDLVSALYSIVKVKSARVQGWATSGGLEAIGRKKKTIFVSVSCESVRFDPKEG